MDDAIPWKLNKIAVSNYGNFMYLKILQLQVIVIWYFLGLDFWKSIIKIPN